MYRIIILLLLSITFPVLAQSNKLISPQEIPEPPEPVEMPITTGVGGRRAYNRRTTGHY